MGRVREMIFKTYIPKHPLLNQYIKMFWYISHSKDEDTHINPKMLPDGHYHMVINLGSPHSFINKNGKEIVLKMSHMNANQNEYISIKRSGTVEIIGIIFRPYGLVPFLRTSINQVAGFVWNMEDLLGNSFNEIEEKLIYEPDLAKKFIIIEKELLAISVGTQVKKEVQFVVNVLMKKKGLIEIRKLSEYTLMSERSLERYFKELIGISPKHFARLQRVQYALKQMKEMKQDFLTVALQSGYYDQSHFYKEFFDMMGVTPKSYCKNKDLLSDLYVQ
jgi:AraC-like DNA-binding protein